MITDIALQLVRALRKLGHTPEQLAARKRERQRIQTARKLRNALTGAHAALGSRALIPHGKQRSAYLAKRW